MKNEVVILIVEDEDAHAALIGRNLRRAGITNGMIRFKDGQEVLDFLFRRSSPDPAGDRAGPAGERAGRVLDKPYLMLLDIKMPRVDGVEVLRQVKRDPELCKLPVIMITTTDDPREIERCHEFGCSSYVTKPVVAEQFVEAIKRLGLYLLVVQVPKLGSGTASLTSA